MNKNTIKYVLAGVLLVAAFWFYKSRQPKYGQGEMSPDFPIEVSGKPAIKLSDLRGKTVLLQFWGTWCGPCRAENPRLAQFYERYHDKGFEIVSVATERNSAAAWKKVIELDGMVWPYHIMESGRFDGPVATLFNIHEIPALYLIDRNGRIIAQNPALPVLDKLLMEQLLTN